MKAQAEESAVLLEIDLLLQEKRMEWLLISEAHQFPWKMLPQEMQEQSLHITFLSKLTNEISRLFFSKAGGVRDVKLIHDRNSRKSKGFGYVEMDTIRAVSEAIQLSGTKLMEKTVMVQASQSEKNAVPSPTAAIGPSHGGPTQLFINSLHVNITEDDLETIFTEFGEVDRITLARDESGNSKGYAYVKYKNGDAAKRALHQVNGQELAGRPLKISLVQGGKDAMEDDDGDGVSLDSSARHVLMAKLAREKENMAFADKLTVTTSNCVLLKNMFSPNDPEVHSNPNFDQEIADDVRDECAKFGRIMHVHCDRKSSEGAVYLRFSQNQEAVKAYTELNGRWFASLQIAAHYIPEKDYLRRFPNAK
jgi:RNA-binding protein 39